MAEDEVNEFISIFCPESDEWNLAGLRDAVYGMFSVTLELDNTGDRDELRDMIIAAVKDAYESREKEAGANVMRYLEKMLLLQVIDAQWKDHLLGIDHIKEGIGLRGYAQRDPLVEYKKEAFDLFANMSQRISSDVLMRLFKIQIRHEEETASKVMAQSTRLTYNRGEGDAGRQPVQKDRKIGRNDPCPCGSGKKYKKCCGT